MQNFIHLCFALPYRRTMYAMDLSIAMAYRASSVVEIVVRVAVVDLKCSPGHLILALQDICLAITSTFAAIVYR